MNTIKMMKQIMSKKTKIKCVGVVLLAFVGSLLATVWPVRLGDLYTNISKGNIYSIKKGVMAVSTFALIYLLAEIVTIIRRVCIDCIVATHEAEIRDLTIKRSLMMPIEYFCGSLSGEKTSQLNQGVNGSSQLIKIMCNDVFATVLTAICTLIQVFLNSSGLFTVIMFVYLALTISISVFQIHSQNGIRESIIAKKNELDGQRCQSILNLEMIRSMNAEDYERKRLLPKILEISRCEKRHHIYMGSFDCVKQFCKILFQALLLVTSILMIARGEMAAGSVITVCLLFQQLVKPVDEVYRFMDEIAASVIKAKSLSEVLENSIDEVYNIPSLEDEKKESSDESAIELEQVIISNPEKNKDLAKYDYVSFPANRIIALQGPNGCGKSTLVRGIMRYYKKKRGTIRLFGRNLDTYSQKDLSKAIYYSPQKSFFISGTVRDNLVYGLEKKFSDEILINALYKVHLTGGDHNDSVIHVDPKTALDSIISENANELSGGMKQRLALARAFLREPKMFIFDEITANLDKEATEYVLTNIEKYARSIQAGIIYISHDEAVVDRCDSIVKLNNLLILENNKVA